MWNSELVDPKWVPAKANAKKGKGKGGKGKKKKQEASPVVSPTGAGQ